MLETYTVLTLSHLVIPFSLFQSFTWHWLLTQGLRSQQGAKSSRKRYRNRSGLEGNEKLTRTMVRERAQNWAQEWNVWEIENEKELGFSVIKCSNETICLIFFSHLFYDELSLKRRWDYTLTETIYPFISLLFLYLLSWREVRCWKWRQICGGRLCFQLPPFVLLRNLATL